MKHTIEPRDEWTDRLSEYIDGELSARESRRLEKHLATCTACTALLDELREVLARAKDLNRAAEVDRDLWPGIERRLTPAPVARPGWLAGLRASSLTPRLAAATAIVLLCVGGVWLWELRARPAEPAATGSSATRAAVDTADREYEARTAALERQARERLTLDPHVVEVLEENLAALDSAIATYRESLAKAPADPQLRQRLHLARQKKIDVLRQAVALASDSVN